MFSTLNQIDIVTKGKRGRKQYVQTDHRTAEEIEAEPELSVLFAVVRIVSPKRVAKEKGDHPVVLYDFQYQPPEFLCQAIRAAGGRLLVCGQPVPVHDDDETPTLEEVMTTAFSNLARRVAEEYKVEFTMKGLEQLENVLAKSAGSVEKDELTYWSSVMKLGSFGGELIRNAIGGQWQVIDRGTIPLALSTSFQGAQAVVNPLGKSMKRFDIGKEDSLAALIHLVLNRP
jgi:hypothetical protein